MKEENEVNDFTFDDIFYSDKPILKLSLSRNDDFLRNDTLDINTFFDNLTEPQKLDFDSTFHTEQPDPSTPMLTSFENFTNNKEQQNTQKSIISNQSQENNQSKKKKPDYKKNICGYITKTIVKQASSEQFKPIIQKLCKRYKVKSETFYQTYRSHQNITGPTHLYGLLTPRLENLDKEDYEKEINLRIVFLTYYKWFLRHRYLRYIMSEGKMLKKDQYIQYKNRELLFIITQEWKSLLKKIKKHLKSNQDSKIDGDKIQDYMILNYEQLIEKNAVEFDSDSTDNLRKLKKETSNKIDRGQKIQIMTEQKQSILETKQENIGIWLDFPFDNEMRETFWQKQ